MTQIALDGADVLHTGRVSRLSGVGRRVTAFRALPNLLTFVGVGISALGLVLLVVAWGKVAGLTNVGLQMPYVISAGFTGLAFVVIGLTVVNIDAKRQDAAERTRQLGELRLLLTELRTTIEEDVR